MKKILPLHDLDYIPTHITDHLKGIVVTQEYKPGVPTLYGFVVRDRQDIEGRYIVVNPDGNTISGKYRGVASLIEELGSTFHFYQLF